MKSGNLVQFKHAQISARIVFKDDVLKATTLSKFVAMVMSQSGILVSVVIGSGNRWSSQHQPPFCCTVLCFRLNMFSKTNN